MKKVILFISVLFLYAVGFSQSDTCAGAAELFNDGEFSFTAGTTTGATDSGGNATEDVFYYVTPSAFQTVNVSLGSTSPTRDTKLVIYSDCTLSTVIAENDDGNGLQGELSFQSDDTSTYYIMVEGGDDALGATVGDFSISVWFEAAVPAPPSPNGVSCSASSTGPIVIFSEEFDDDSGGWTGLSISNDPGNWEVGIGTGNHSTDTGPSGAFSGVSYMNYEASGTAQAGVASAISPAIDLTGIIVEDVELTFYMHAYGIDMGTLNVGVGTSASGPFTNELVWTGQYQSASSEDWYQVGVDLSVYIGQIIYLELEHTGAGTSFHGDMSIDLLEISTCISTPSNDDCANATAITAVPYNITQDARGTTNNSGFITSCSDGMNNGVWYTFTPGIDGSVSIELSNINGWDPELALYSGSCGSFVCEINTDVGGVGVNESILNFDVFNGTQYLINIGGQDHLSDTTEGVFDLDVSAGVGFTLGIDEVDMTDKITIYPNPTNDILNIRTNEIVDYIGLYNMLGQEVRIITPTNRQSIIDVSSLESGVYFVKVKIADTVNSYKIVKK